MGFAESGQQREVVGSALLPEAAQHRELGPLAFVQAAAKPRRPRGNHVREGRADVFLARLGHVALPVLLHRSFAPRPEEEMPADDGVQRRQGDIDPEQGDVRRQEALANALQKRRLVGAVEPLRDDPLDDRVCLLGRHSFHPSGQPDAVSGRVAPPVP